MAETMEERMSLIVFSGTVGDVKIYACSMTLELFGMNLEGLEPIVDDVTGVATFVERAKEGRITLFI